MRLTTFVVTVGMLAAAAGSARAQPADDPATDHYFAELERVCPESQLQLLSSSGLRDGLDDFIAGLPQETQDQMRRAETTQCSGAETGASCVNSADLAIVDQLDMTSRLATSICQTFLRCRAQGECDPAR